MMYSKKSMDGSPKKPMTTVKKSTITKKYTAEGKSEPMQSSAGYASKKVNTKVNMPSKTKK